VSASWDNSALIAALNNLALQQGGWVMDGASSHMSPDDGNISSPAPLSSPHFVTIGNGHTVPITSSGHTSVRTPSGHTFKLNHVLLVLTLIHNLLSIHKFTRDNCCSIEFDAFGFSVKDLKTHRVILHCNSDGERYTFPGTTSTRQAPPTTSLALMLLVLWKACSSADDSTLLIFCSAPEWPSVTPARHPLILRLKFLT
jgi:hypothetical protein